MSSATAVKKAEATAPAAVNPIKEAIAQATPPVTALLRAELWARDGVKLQSWDVVPPAGTPFEHVLVPAFWANVADRLLPGATLLVFPGDCKWYAELIVFDAGKNFAHVAVKFGPLARPEIGPAPGVLEDFEVRYHPSKGWQAVQKSTGRVLHDNFANAEEARRWFIEHQRVLRR